MPFVPNDPDDFLDYPRMREVLCRHEAGHLFLAYYYGYQIGMFRYWDSAGFCRDLERTTVDWARAMQSWDWRAG